MAHETVRRVISGQSVSVASVRKVADALGVDVEKIHEWRGEAPPDYGNAFEPDPSASLLTTEERAVINSLIRLLTASRDEQREDGGEHAQRSAPNTPAGTRPALADPIDDAGFESPDPPPAGGASSRGRRGRGQE